MTTPYTLPNETRILSVTLRVADLDRALGFYADALGLTAQIGADGAALSADAGPAIVRLVEDRTAVPRPARATGLYHHAIRFPSRAALATVLRRLIERRTRFQGFSDHGVSEAIYLADADGLGVELYRDRPRHEWPVDGAGGIDMVTVALDLDDLLTESAPSWPGIAAETDIGHIHLHVSDLRRAEAFYSDLLGFSVMQRSYPGALFVAAGGYHHHIGLNTWAGTARPPANAVGLMATRIGLPAAGLATLAARVQASGRPWTAIADGFSVSDDDGNLFEFVG